MAKEVLEVGGKRCKFGAIEIEHSSLLLTCSVFEISSGFFAQTQVPREYFCEAPAYDSAEQLILDP